MSYIPKVGDRVRVVSSPGPNDLGEIEVVRLLAVRPDGPRVCHFYVEGCGERGEIQVSLHRDTVFEPIVPTTDRAARRREYVHKWAPRMFIGMMADPSNLDVDWVEMRREAIEQAGLLFDETEES